jgi:hypothetical protein
VREGRNRGAGTEVSPSETVVNQKLGMIKERGGTDKQRHLLDTAATALHFCGALCA